MSALPDLYRALTDIFGPLDQLPDKFDPKPLLKEFERKTFPSKPSDPPKRISISKASPSKARSFGLYCGATPDMPDVVLDENLCQKAGLMTHPTCERAATATGKRSDC